MFSTRSMTPLAIKVTVACDFPFPTAPAGETLDPNTIQIEYTKGTGGSDLYHQVKTPAECDAGAFYVENDGVYLCPGACAAVQADSQASIDIKFGCDVGFVK